MLQLLLLQQLLLLPLSRRLLLLLWSVELTLLLELLLLHLQLMLLLLLLLLSLLLLPLLLLHIIYQPTALSHFLLQLPTPSVSLRTPVDEASPRPLLRRQSVDDPTTSCKSIGVVEIRKRVVGLLHRRRARRFDFRDQIRYPLIDGISSLDRRQI